MGVEFPQSLAVPSLSAAGTLLKAVSYQPAGAVTNVPPTLATTDIDAANLKADFIVPQSGAVLWRFTSLGNGFPANSSLFWSIREGAADVPLTYCAITDNGSQIRYSYAVVVTGLTAAQAKTWKAGHGVAFNGAGTCATKYGGTAASFFGPATIEVWGL